MFCALLSCTTPAAGRSSLPTLTPSKPLLQEQQLALALLRAAMKSHPEINEVLAPHCWLCSTTCLSFWEAFLTLLS